MLVRLLFDPDQATGRARALLRRKIQPANVDHILFVNEYN
jgi:hypothetical protein